MTCALRKLWTDEEGEQTRPHVNDLQSELALASHSDSDSDSAQEGAERDIFCVDVARHVRSGTRMAARRRRIPLAALAFGTVMCGHMVSGFMISVARPAAVTDALLQSLAGNVRNLFGQTAAFKDQTDTNNRRPRRLSSIRCHSAHAEDASSQRKFSSSLTPTLQEQLARITDRNLLAVRATAGEEAVDKLVESTRQIGGIISARLVDVGPKTEQVQEFVGVWASWLNANCPIDLTATLAGLTDERASQRKAAVTRLLKGLSVAEGQSAVAEKGNNWAFAALAARLGDNSAAVREAAVKALASISEKGNRNVVLAMASLIEEDKTITVRSAALRAIRRVAQRGDQEALAPVLNLLKLVEGTERGDFFEPNLSSEINRQAVKALSTLADPGNEGAIKALSLRIMDDPNPAGPYFLERKDLEQLLVAPDTSPSPKKSTQRLVRVAISHVTLSL